MELISVTNVTLGTTSLANSVDLSVLSGVAALGIERDLGALLSRGITGVDHNGTR
jgi:hypothetical protein